jgi:hypothetical protein
MSNRAHAVSDHPGQLQLWPTVERRRTGDVPGPYAVRLRAQRNFERAEREAETRRLYGHDPGALERCGWCGEGHPPGFCTVPAEHDLVCAGQRDRCPRPCVSVCVLNLACPVCASRDGAWCTDQSGQQAEDLHQDSL